MTEPLTTATTENVKCPHCGHTLTNETLDAIAAAAVRAVNRVYDGNERLRLSTEKAYVGYIIKPSASTWP